MNKTKWTESAEPVDCLLYSLQAMLILCCVCQRGEIQICLCHLFKMNGSYVMVTVGGCVYLPPCSPTWSVCLWKSHAEGYEHRVNRWSVSVIVRAEKQSWGMWPLTWFISSVRIASMFCSQTNVTNKFQTISFPKQKHTAVKLNFVLTDLLETFTHSEFAQFALHANSRL